jgi:hypothetical protein
MPAHHIRTKCLHALPPLGSPLANPPTTATAPRATASARSTQQHPMHSGGSQAPAHSTAGCRCTQRTTEVQRRQLSHPFETRCQRRCPICSDLIACTHCHPSARPSKIPHHSLQPHAQPPQPTARNIIHAQPAFASNRSQRSCPPMHAAYQRGSDTSAASSVRDSMPATLPQLLRRHYLHAPPPLGSPLAKPQPPAAAPRAPAPARSTQHHPMHSRRSQPPAHSAAGRRCTQRTTEVQRRQLRHPFETRCQRRCPI